MNKQVLGVSAALVGVIGMLVRFGEAMIRGHLMSVETLPAWAVFGTAGTSFTTYTTIVRMAVPGLIVLIAVVVGYSLGRQYDLTREYRSFGKTVALGSTLGVSLVALVTLWPSLTSIGDYPATMSTAQATELFVMDIVLLGVILLAYLVEIALVVTVGMLAGAAFAPFQAGEDPPADPTDADTTASSTSASPSTDDSPESQSYPAK